MYHTRHRKMEVVYQIWHSDLSIPKSVTFVSPCKFVRVHPILLMDEEYVASLIGLNKNNSAVCAGIDFLLIWPLYTI